MTPCSSRQFRRSLRRTKLTLQRAIAARCQGSMTLLRDIDARDAETAAYL